MTTGNSTHTHISPGAAQNAWDAIAAGYDEYVTPTHLRLANEALDHIEIGRDTRFLDVAAGSGALAISAARRGARVLGTDISSGMIEALNANARRHGLDNLSGQVMDGHHLDLNDDSFDASGSMFGVMLFPDLPLGLREMARVTKPGGKVLVVTFGPPPRVEFLTFFIAAAKRAVPDFAGLPMDPPPLPFQVSDPAKLEDVMTHAGLEMVQVETTIEIQQFGGADDLWNWVTHSNPIGANLVRGLSPYQSATVREVLEGMLRERSGGTDLARLSNLINIGIGTA